MKKFCHDFKKQRLEYGYSQADVGLSMSRRFGTDLSQTTISRFEAYNLSQKNMSKLKPIFESWIAQASESFRRGITARRFLQSDLVAAQERAKAAGMNVNVLLRTNMANAPDWPSQHDFYQFENYFDSPFSCPTPQNEPIVKNEMSTSAPPEYDVGPPYLGCIPSLQDSSHHLTSSLSMSQTQADIVNEFMSNPENLSPLVNNQGFIPPCCPKIESKPRRCSVDKRSHVQPEMERVESVSVPIVFVPGDPIYVGRKRRKRTVLTEEQRKCLIYEFQEHHNPSQARISEIANRLQLDRFVVRVWFANRRQAMRKRRLYGREEEYYDHSYAKVMGQFDDGMVRRKMEMQEMGTQELRMAKEEAIDFMDSEYAPPPARDYAPFAIDICDDYIPNDPTVFNPSHDQLHNQMTHPVPPISTCTDYVWGSMFYGGSFDGSQFV